MLRLPWFVAELLLGLTVDLADSCSLFREMLLELKSRGHLQLWYGFRLLGKRTCESREDAISMTLFGYDSSSD